MAKLTFYLLVCLFGVGSPFPRKLAQTDEQDEQHSSCQTSGTVMEGDRAQIFCRFSRPNQGFMVYRLTPSNGSDTTARKSSIPVVCPRQEEDRHLADGHKVTISSNRDQATIEIESVTQEHSGEYFCKTQPAADDHATSCTLTVQSNTIRTRNLVTCKTGSQVPVGQEASVVCEFSKSIGSTGITLTKHGPSPGEIMRCDKKRKCEIKKEGYSIAEKTDTFVKLRIHSAKADHAGDYVCSSAELIGVRGRCTLELMQVLPENDDDDDEQLTTSHVVLAICGVMVVSTAALFVAASYCAWKNGFCCGTNPAHNMNSMGNGTPFLLENSTQPNIS